MLLRDYLQKHRISPQAFAERMGVSRPAVTFWIGGRVRPSPRHAKKIKTITRGEVGADDLQRAWEMAQ